MRVLAAARPAGPAPTKVSSCSSKGDLRSYRSHRLISPFLCKLQVISYGGRSLDVNTEQTRLLRLKRTSGN